MTKGIPTSRSLNLVSTTREAKRVLLQTKSWDRTEEHMKYWIKQQFGLSQNTTSDYITTAAARLMKDPETKELFI